MEHIQIRNVVSNETGLMKMPSVKRKKSHIWTHFSKTDNAQRLKCSYCQRVCSISCGSTGNLIRHLRLKHPTVNMDKAKNESVGNHEISYEYSMGVPGSPNEVVQAVLELGCSTPANMAKPDHEAVVLQQQQQQQQQLQYYILETVDESKSKELNEQLLKMIVKEFHPFTVVDNPEFRKLVTMLNPAYTLPSHKDLKKNLLPQIYQATMDELKSTLKEVTAVALTTDRWTSINNERYIAVTAHYLNTDFQLKSTFLSCTSFPEKHSSSNIATFLQSVATEWELSDKVVAVVTDNVPSMISSVRERKWQHVSCFASILNKIVKAGLAEIKPLIEKIRQTVGYFKRNTAALNTLFEIQNEIGLPDLKMKIDVPARWNSTFEMIAKFFKNKESLQSAVKKLQLNFFQLSSYDWIVVEKAIKLLIIFNSVIVEISAENTLSLSKVPYMVRFMVKHVTNILAQNNLPTEIQKMASMYKEELQKYFKELESNAVVGQCVLLDPRFKKRGFPENSFNEAYSSLCNQISSLKSEMMNKKSSLNQTETEGDKTNSEYFIDIWCEFKENEPEPRNNANEAAIAEISTFINDEYLSLSDDPVTYWGNALNQSKFPTLFELVKRRLCIPAVAVPGQRLFTKQGTTLLEKRNCLTSGKLKEILFLSHNLENVI